jgi:uncharacterized protein (TIGR02646 family)
MRPLTKVAKPQVLVSNEDTWTAAYAEALPEERPRHERWRHAEIKAALREELGGKCAYCEALVEDVSFPHVEHIIPKSIRPDLAHRWHNLTSACGRCNIAKGDFFHADRGLLNPYEDDVDAHLMFLGELIHPALGSARGTLTIKKLGLDRLDLVNSRGTRLTAIRDALEAWHAAEEPLKSVLEEGLRLDAQEGEFTRSVTAYLRSFEFPI